MRRRYPQTKSSLKRNFCTGQKLLKVLAPSTVRTRAKWCYVRSMCPPRGSPQLRTVKHNIGRKRQKYKYVVSVGWSAKCGLQCWFVLSPSKKLLLRYLPQVLASSFSRHTVMQSHEIIEPSLDRPAHSPKIDLDSHPTVHTRKRGELVYKSTWMHVLLTG